jgi:tetratricopeptide (TPR) repeat protein
MWRRFVLTLVAGAALGACTPQAQQSPNWFVCKQAGTDQASLERRAQACTALIQGEASRPEDLALAYRLHAEALRLSGAPDSALQDLNKGIALNAGDALAFDERGLDELMLNRLDPAAADFDTAIRLEPQGAPGYDDRSALERLRGNLTGALRDADRAIALKPDWADPWGERGLVYLAKRRFDMALADFAQTLKLDAGQAFALDGAGAAQAGKGDSKDAMSDYGRAEGLYIARRNYRAALADANREVVLAPDDPEAWNGRCWTRAIANIELEAALADCQKSLQIRPGAADATDSLAFVQFRMRRFVDAVRNYDAAYTKDQSQTSSLFMRGVSKLRAGDAVGGQSDIDTAKNTDATVVDQYAGYGVTPQGQ